MLGAQWHSSGSFGVLAVPNSLRVAIGGERMNFLKVTMNESVDIPSPGHFACCRPSPARYNGRQPSDRALAVPISRPLVASLVPVPCSRLSSNAPSPVPSHACAMHLSLGVSYHITLTASPFATHR